MMHFGGVVHAFGYNSAESELNWMKSGALYSTFCRVWPWQILGTMHAATYNFPISQLMKFEYNTLIGVAMKLLNRI